MYEVKYPHLIEQLINNIEYLLQQSWHDVLQEYSHLSPRGLSLLILEKDKDILSRLQQTAVISPIQTLVAQLESQLAKPISQVIQETRSQRALELEQQVLLLQGDSNRRGISQLGIGEKLHHLMIHPITGFLILILVVYFGIYQFVGNFGAGTLVDTIEGYFEEKINPLVNKIVALLFPWPVIQDLLANDYGIITLGIRYATALILPIVSTYFLMFALLEDTGYLPRLSLMLDRLFKLIGLSGRGVIPMVLGLGCDTMATVVTRTLATKRERIIATFLLALAVPCAAQWGVILGLLASHPKGLLIWAVVVTSIFLIAGATISRILPGKAAYFYMEVPPLRLPKLENVLIKTYTRMKTYYLEILPLFVYASIFIWFGRITGIFDLIIGWLNPLTVSLGLPEAVSPVFLYGFFRRDYGAAGLFDIQETLTINQLVVCAIILTLFLPCIAQLQVMLKERGWKTTLAIISFIFPFAFFIGFVTSRILLFTGLFL